MNRRTEIYLCRVIIALLAQIERSSTKERGQFPAQMKTDMDKSAEWWRLLTPQDQSKAFVQLALAGPPGCIAEAVKIAGEAFGNQKEIFDSFIGDLGIASKRKARRPIYGHHGRILMMSWDGFDLESFPFRSEREAAIVRRLPPLSRWNGRAAWQFIKMITHEPGLDYRTYRQRVSRLCLNQVKPILVKKIKIDPSAFAITWTPLGMQWFRENHSLGAVTRNRKKLSHDKVTKLPINSVGEKTRTYLASSRNRRPRST